MRNWRHSKNRTTYFSKFSYPFFIPFKMNNNVEHQIVTFNDETFPIDFHNGIFVMMKDSDKQISAITICKIFKI
jgi:hypothetical protein